jgi:hypothetical protein
MAHSVINRAVALLIVAIVQSALAKPPYSYIPASASCPAFNTKNNWHTYLSGTSYVPGRTIDPLLNFDKFVGPVSSTGWVSMGLEFRQAKAVNDPDAMGRLDSSACYEMIRRFENGKPTFMSNRVYSYGTGHATSADSHTMEHLVADPLRYQINVEGIILLFDDAGQVYDHRGRVVGYLLCFISDGCEGY